MCKLKTFSFSRFFLSSQCHTFTQMRISVCLFSIFNISLIRKRLLCLSVFRCGTISSGGSVSSGNDIVVNLPIANKHLVTFLSYQMKRVIWPYHVVFNIVMVKVISSDHGNWQGRQDLPAGTLGCNNQWLLATKSYNAQWYITWSYSMGWSYHLLEP